MERDNACSQISRMPPSYYDSKPYIAMCVERWYDCVSMFYVPRGGGGGSSSLALS